MAESLLSSRIHILRYKVWYNKLMRGSSKGFTLIELMVVVTILAILSTAAVAVYGNVQKNSRFAKRVSDLENIHSALGLYREDNDHYPISTVWRSECAIDGVGGNLSANDVIPGLTPKYVQGFPSDPQMDKANKTSCYMYISNDLGTEYKFIDSKISDFVSEDYQKNKGLIDPARDGGADSCKVDGSSPQAWGYYTFGACGL